MIEGSAFATELGDRGAGDWYTKQANAITASLERHWSNDRGFVISGFENDNIIRSGLDISVILAVLHSDVGDNLTFNMIDDRVLATVHPLVESFRPIYKINAITQDNEGRPLGLAVGRYQEDTYDGVNNSRGNPWYLATSAIAEYVYKVSSAFKKKGVIPVTKRSMSFFKDFLGLSSVYPGAVYTEGDEQYNAIHEALLNTGDAYMRRIMFHSHAGRLPEEYTREEGQERGAKDLTWSYAAVLTAAAARNALM